MVERTGPALAIVGSCGGCPHLRPSTVGGHRLGFVDCAHPLKPVPFIGNVNTSITTPADCPELAPARFALARAIVAEADASAEEAAPTKEPKRKRPSKWIRVAPGEAAALGVKDPNAGWIWRSPVGLYFVWVQERPRHEPPYYAGARVGADGHPDTYTRQGGPKRPAWVASMGRPSSWLCDSGTFSEAKEACHEDARQRAASAPHGAQEESDQ